MPQQAIQKSEKITGFVLSNNNHFVVKLISQLVDKTVNYSSACAFFQLLATKNGRMQAMKI